MAPAPAPVMAAPMPAPMPEPSPVPAAPIEANIAKAQSGAVPFSDIKSPPGGPLQIAVIQFGRGSSGLGGNDFDVLAKVAQIQRRNGGRLRIVAHADQDATGVSAAQLENGNYEVSRRRALAVARQLIALGVPRDRIVAEAASDDEPLFQTTSARGIAANRRADIYFDF